MNHGKLHGVVIAAAVLVSAVIGMAGTALGLPCKGWLATTGDSMEEVAGKCGDAMYKEQRVVKQEITETNGSVSNTTAVVDLWAFDFGPDELMQSYRFENGKLVEIDNIGYGRSPESTDDTCRNGESLAVGDTSIETFLKCGEPLAKEPQADKIIETKSGGETRRTTVPVVEWTYRYGPDLPGWTLRIEDGKVTEIRKREFGK